MVASTTANTPMPTSSGVRAKPRVTMAPTSTMPCTKLAPDMSGVWRITGTAPMIT